ncbi:phosphatidylinositol mannoside acyltransferase [Nakamurella leprariae]|uniref:Phosphatidylinositol mannoside acyltransferase n=1 Tax=Nakamurella leprariae TaxID=2803911 RepID=A0A938Y757_9ACTN|nr:phosphatidylinositol mannoside acyltransferase [Nakamurella leprariae]MBM9467055.1 phosphatidylinositol mannoside acyltransferase [Nakamurella leprariae]
MSQDTLHAESSRTGRGAVDRWTDRLAGAGYAAGWRTVSGLPRPVAERAFRLAADRAARRHGPRTVQLARNYRRVLGDTATPSTLAAVVGAGMRSYARYWRETFQLPGLDHAAVTATATAGTIGLEHLDAAVDAGRGAILALPHSGNWDVAGLFVTRRYGALVTVAERLRPESLYEQFVAYRESLGMEILPLTGGGAGPSQVLKDRLRAGKVVALLADRDLTASGVPVDFFGEPTRMPAGPALLAATTGAALLPVHLSFTDDGWRQVVAPPLQLPGRRLAEQVRGGTQLLADFFAQEIGEHPADWHMLQPLWLADLDPERLARQPADRSAS